jgi:hypothetical protein
LRCARSRAGARHLAVAGEQDPGHVGILAGAILIGFNPSRWDVVVAALPHGHGIHVRDLVGMALIAAGSLVLWHAPSRR